MFRPAFFVLFLCQLWLATGAAAFTFADGATTQCIAGGQVVAEIRTEPGDKFYNSNRTAMTIPMGTGYQILWNVQKFDALPPHMRDFLFFHECAHAQLPTSNEEAANCGGLKAMRAAGRAGSEVEAKIAEFYGPKNSFWLGTLACANAAAPAAAK